MDNCGNSLIFTSFKKNVIVHRGIVMLVATFGLLLGMAHAQEWEVGIQGGASGYMGDLNPENPLAYNDWTAGGFVKYNLNHTWGVRANFVYANIWADDNKSSIDQRRTRGLSFFGNVKEVSLITDFNFFRWLPQRGRVVYTPYIFAGLSGIQFEPKNYLPSSGKKVKLREMQTEYDTLYNQGKYGKHALAIPFGVGFKYNLRGPWSIGAEIGYRLALTDYLDDVSGVYPRQIPPSDLPENATAADWYYLTYRNAPSAQPGSQRGDGRPYDSYMTASITLSFTIFKGGCPEWQ